MLGPVSKLRRYLVTKVCDKLMRCIFIHTQVTKQMLGCPMKHEDPKLANLHFEAQKSAHLFKQATQKSELVDGVLRICIS